MTTVVTTIYVVAPAASSISSAPTPMSATSKSNNAGIIAGAVIGGIAFVSILSIGIVIFVRRRRRRTPGIEAGSRALGERSLNRRGKPASEGSSPLLVTPLAWSHHDLEESNGSGTGTLPGTSGTPATSDYSPGVAGVGAAGGFSQLHPGSHSRGLSGDSATPLMQSHKHDSSDSDVTAYYHIVPSPTQGRGVQRTRTGDTIASSYSQASASTHAYHELERARSLSPPPPVPALPPQLQLPHIPRTEPLTDLGDLLRSRAAATSAPTPSGSLDTDAFSPSSQYAQSSRQNTLSSGPSLSRSGGSRSKSSTGPSPRSRRLLQRAPMEPVLEQEGSKPAGNSPIHDRWSMAADPGGSHPRPTRSRSPQLQPAPDPVSRPSSSGSRENHTAFGYGMSLLTSAFRKSLSASSIATQGSSSTSQGHNSDSGYGGGGAGVGGGLSGYPSVASLGASSTGSFYTAVSDIGTSGQGGRKSKKKGGSSMRTSLASYPSIPSLPSSTPAGRGREDIPPVPPLPPLPANLLSPGPSTVPASVPYTGTKATTTPNLPPNSNPNSSPSKPKAHLRKVPDPHTRSDSERDVPRLVRAGASAHGVVGLVEGQK